MRHLTGINAIIGNTWLALAAALHFYFAGWGYPEPLKLATLHLTIFLPAVFVLFPWRRTTYSEDIEDVTAPQPSINDWGLAIISTIPRAMPISIRNASTTARCSSSR